MVWKGREKSQQCKRWQCKGLEVQILCVAGDDGKPCWQWAWEELAASLQACETISPTALIAYQVPISNGCSLAWTNAAKSQKRPGCRGIRLILGSHWMSNCLFSKNGHLEYTVINPSAFLSFWFKRSDSGDIFGHIQSWGCGLLKEEEQYPESSVFYETKFLFRIMDLKSWHVFDLINTGIEYLQYLKRTSGIQIVLCSV